MVYVHTILRDVAGLFKVGRLVAYAVLTQHPTRGLIRQHPALRNRAPVAGLRDCLAPYAEIEW